MRFLGRFWSLPCRVPLDEVAKAADGKVEVRPDFRGAVAPIDEVQRFFHASKGRAAVALQSFRHVLAHTHPHRARVRHTTFMDANGR